MKESSTGEKFSQAYGHRGRGALLIIVALPVIATLALVAVGVFRGRPADFAQLLSNGPTSWRVYADSGAVGTDWGERTETASIFGEGHEQWSVEAQGCATQAWPTTPSAGLCDRESSGIHGPHTLESLLPVVAWNGAAFVLGLVDNEVNDISGQKGHDGAFLPAPVLGQELPRDVASSTDAGLFGMNEAKMVAPAKDPSRRDLDADLGWAEGAAIQLSCLTLPLPLQALEAGILPGKDSDGRDVSLMNFESLVAAEANCPSAFLWR